MSESKEAKRLPIRIWLSRHFEWRIPVYQRHYSWDADARDSSPVHLFWETVAGHVDARLNGASPSAHYLGAVLVDNKTSSSDIGNIKKFDVVDGQQRLTTIQIALFSLIKTAKEHNCDGFESELAQYIFSDYGSESEYARAGGQSNPKLCPTNFDKNQFDSILFHVYNKVPEDAMSDAVMENQQKSRVRVAFDFFRKMMNELLVQYSEPKSKVLSVLQDVLLDDFELYVIALEETDEAQKIFASMNNTAKPLTTFDLIRNDVFYRAAQEGEGKDEKLFKTNEWQMLEHPFWEESSDQRQRKDSTPHIDAYLARMLVAKLKRAVNFNRTDVFKTYQEFGEAIGNVEKEIKSTIEYADIYKHLMGGPVNNPLLARFEFGPFVTQRTKWHNKDFYPVLFVILSGSADFDEKQLMLSLLESYVIRRHVCGLSTDHYNQLAPNWCKGLGAHPSYASLHDLLIKEKADSSKFPTDEEVQNACRTVPFYGSKVQEYVLEQYNESIHADGDEVEITATKLTVDHILPQGWEASESTAEHESWSEQLLRDVPAAEVETRKGTINMRVQTIGNLTLLGNKKNSRKSNDPFGKVKKLLAGSNVLMNRAIAENSEWGEREILERGSKIADFICQHWTANPR